MKKVIFFIVISMIFSLRGESQSYFPFPDSNAIWSEVYSHLQPEITEAYQYGIQGDTLINSVLYHKIYYLNDTIYPLVTGQYAGAMREDSLKRIYVIDCAYCENDAGSEMILYDFSKEINDTVFVGSFGMGPLGYYVVEYFDSIMIDGNYRKTIHFYGYEDMEYWIEGIGSTRGLFSPLMPVPTGYSSWELICFNQDGMVRYLNPAYNTCFPILTGIEENKSEINLPRLSPNPVSNSGILDFSGSAVKYTRLIIFDGQGRRIRDLELNNSKSFVINGTEYKSGIYFYQLISDKMEIYSSKFLIIK